MNLLQKWETIFISKLKNWAIEMLMLVMILMGISQIWNKRIFHKISKTLA